MIKVNSREALSALMKPARRAQLVAAGLSVISAAIWPIQAFVVASALAHAVQGQSFQADTTALLFIGLGLSRSLLNYLSDWSAQAGADKAIAAARSNITLRESQRAEESRFGGAAAIASLATEKLETLSPYATRYVPAQMRVMLVSPLILLLGLTQSWIAALIFIISGPLIPLFMALVGMAAEKASQKQMAEIGSINDLLAERLSAILDIRLLGASKLVEDGFREHAQSLRQRTMAVLRIAFLSSTVLELFAAIGVAMMAVYVGFSLLGQIQIGSWTGPLSVQAGIFLLLIAPDFYQPLRDLAAAWHDRAAARAVALEYFAWDADQTAKLAGSGKREQALAGAASIRLSHCRAPSGAALPDISIAAGETVALVGPSGAGKTSMLRLIAGFTLPEEGRVEVAGQCLTADNADGWRARIGWMPQAPHFLNSGLHWNLSLGRKGNLQQALSRSGAQDVVGRLPDKLATRLGETGAGISGGEARRLTLARAIYEQPDILLADEPTADLDEETAQAVTDGLIAQAKSGATIIIATHDMTLANRMDRVIRIGAA